MALCDLSGFFELNVHCRMQDSKSYDPQPIKGVAQKKKPKVQQQTYSGKDSFPRPLEVDLRIHHVDEPG